MAVYQYFSYFILFKQEQDARAFPQYLPPDCTWEIQEPDASEPDRELNPWAVIVKGPWEDPADAEEILTPLAEQHGGEYDGEEDVT